MMKERRQQILDAIEKFKDQVARFFEENKAIFAGLIAMNQAHPIPEEPEEKK